MIRTILVTQVVDKQGNDKQMYGRFDVVAAFNNGLTVKEQYKAEFEMSDSDFAKYGKFKRVVNE